MYCTFGLFFFYCIWLTGRMPRQRKPYAILTEKRVVGRGIGRASGHIRNQACWAGKGIKRMGGWPGDGRIECSNHTPPNLRSNAAPNLTHAILTPTHTFQKLEATRHHTPYTVNLNPKLNQKINKFEHPPNRHQHSGCLQAPFYGGPQTGPKPSPVKSCMQAGL